MKKIYFILILIFFGLFSACSTQTNLNNKNLIITTFYPVQEITKNIIGNNSNFTVKVLIPLGAEPHNFQPTVKQIVELSNAKILIGMGGMFNSIEQKVINSNENIIYFNSIQDINLLTKQSEFLNESKLKYYNLLNKNISKLCIDNGGKYSLKFYECLGIGENTCKNIGGIFNPCASACRNIPDAMVCTMQCVQVCDFKDKFKDNNILKSSNYIKYNNISDFSSYDPHIWLSIDNMIIMTRNIEKELIKIYPNYKLSFHKNAKIYITKLENLKKLYDKNLLNCKQDKILVNHKAFGYIGNDYGFRQISISGFTPESEPSPKLIQKVIDTAKENNIKYVFIEDQLDSKATQTIANDIGGQIFKLKVIKENENESYISIMKHNLDNLKIALECN